VPKLVKFASSHLGRLAIRPDVPVAHASLHEAASELSKRISRFGWTVEKTIARYKEALLEAGYAHERLADAAIALHTASCTISRLDHDLRANPRDLAQIEAGRLYLLMANRRFDQAVLDLSHNDDPAVTKVADLALGR
jgi:hypothetical protein